MRAMLPRVIAVISSAALLAVPACSDSSGPPDAEGGVRFTYDGTLAGTFLATGSASNAFDPLQSFAVAYRSEAGELQLCAYQPTGGGQGNFLLLNAGIVRSPGQYDVPPGWAIGARSYQPGMFLVGVDSTRTGIERTWLFTTGRVYVFGSADGRAQGRFRINTRPAVLDSGTFDVPLVQKGDLPVLCG